MRQITTIKELKDAINHLDDDTPILATSRNIGAGNLLKQGIYLSQDKYAISHRDCRARVDGTPYSVAEYVPDENGSIAIKIT